MTRRATFGLLLALSCWGCEGRERSGATVSPAAASAWMPSGSATASTTPSSGPRLHALLRAELQRRAELVAEADLSSRDVSVRRAAARALARIRGPRVSERLFRLLHDEDEEVVAWAAYGLGDDCLHHRDKAAPALSAVGASWRDKHDDKAPLSAPDAIARSIGRCGEARAEQVLVAWARSGGAGAEAAIHALGDVVAALPRPREETFVALLELAAGDASHEPRPAALYPLGRAPHLPEAVIERAREVAVARLRDKGPARVFAVRTLARTDDPAAAELGKVLTDPGGYDAAERAEAARGLGRMGRPGQRALQEALPKLVPNTADALTATSLVSPDFGPTLVALQSVTDIGKARPTLQKLATLAVAGDAPASVKRRASWLRCAAAQLLAERNYLDPLLTKCDLEAQDKDGVATGSIGARAIVAAIGVDAAKIRGKRLAAWRQYAARAPLRARQAAVALIGEHAEIQGAEDVLAQSLGAAEPGLCATAAEVIAKHPGRVTAEGPKGVKVHEGVRQALIARLDGKGAAADVEALSAVIDAVGVLRLTEAEPKLTAWCSSPYEVVREHTQKALAALGGTSRATCARPSGGLPLGVEIEHIARGSHELVLQTDAGELSLKLDARFAPVAVTRVLDLAKSGFYDGMVVHRVVSGFVSQLGSPTADGYGGAPGRAAMPCETSPLAFRSLAVGVALAGRDTGSSQIFVTHADVPHLAGRYAWIGTAEGPWEALVDGDRITKVTLR